MSDNRLEFSEMLAQEYKHIHSETVQLNNYPTVQAATDEEREQARQKVIFQKMHNKNHAALCLSGGGIRSATFALGLIQGLANKGLLEKFDYLSTVSGGGYIGSWLSAWIHRESEGIEGVIKKLNSEKPEPKQIHHLREFSNYLTPQYGLTTDTWTAIAILTRNMVLNLSVLIPIIVVFLALPRLLLTIFLWNPKYKDVLSCMAVIGGGISGIIGLTYLSVYLPSERENLHAWFKTKVEAEEKKNGGATKFYVLCVIPIVISGLLLTTYWAWQSDVAKRPDLKWFLGFTTVLNFIPAILSSIWVKPNRTYFLKQLLTIVVAGASAGLIAYPIAHNLFANPIDLNQDNSIKTALYVCLAFPLVLIAFFLATSIFVAVASRYDEDLNKEKSKAGNLGDQNREWIARLGAWVLIAAVVWMGFSLLSLFGPYGLFYANKTVQKAILTAGGVSGLLVRFLGKSASTSATSEKGNGRLQNLVLAIAAPIFVVFLLAVLSWGTSEVIVLVWKVINYAHAGEIFNVAIYADNYSEFARHLYIINHSSLRLLPALLFIIGGLGMVMGFVINVNKFSMHGMYRDRLIRAYLGASHNKRKPNPVTGFDTEDNLKLHKLQKTERGREQKPFHVINMALNLVKGQELAWQERKAESFTASALHCGSCQSNIGYRKSQYYGDEISLGTAVAISGAAVNPNMGYHSSPALTFLLTLFNVRLGWWLGNPQNEKTYKRGYPMVSVLPIFEEAFGFTDDKNRYINLSDGGHFDNLGLYEMVLRRCKFIVVSDAGGDGKFIFDDLGNAIRKIRIDFGIPIEMERISMFPCSDKPEQNEKGRYCAVGKIKYSAVDKKLDGSSEEDGFLIYLKPTFYERNEPTDVFNYAKSNPTFPHQTTVDQFFSESQFESYRSLGLYTIEQICEGKWNPSKFGNEVDAFKAFYGAASDRAKGLVGYHHDFLQGMNDEEERII